MAGYVGPHQPKISFNNNCTNLRFSSRFSTVEPTACDQCKLLEDRIKEQNEELHRRERGREEMRALIDWLKRDVGKAEARIREFETGKMEEDYTSQNFGKYDGTEWGENVRRPANQEQLTNAKLESLQRKLSERCEKLSQLEEKIDEYETKIERLQRSHQAYFEEVRELNSKVRQQTKDLRINKEIEAEKEEKIRRLVVDNEHLCYMICRQKRHIDEYIDDEKDP